MKKNYVEKKEPNYSTRTDQVWLNGDEVCRILRISSRTLFTYRMSGRLPYAQIGRKILYKLQDVTALLENHYVKSAELREGLSNVY
jgi:hypothetical protein